MQWEEMKNTWVGEVIECEDIGKKKRGKPEARFMNTILEGAVKLEVMKKYTDQKAKWRNKICWDNSWLGDIRKENIVEDFIAKLIRIKWELNWLMLEIISWVFSVTQA